MKVVLDTNVLIAAFATHGLCESIFTVCLGAHELVLSEHILAECRKHLVKKVKLDARAADDIVNFLREQAEMVTPAPVHPGACPDPDDLPVLGTALAGPADALVTGDAELLKIKVIQGIPILSPRAFYERLT